MNCAETTHALGAYVLGALEPCERAEVERHLTACPHCEHELAELAGLPPLLGRLTLDEVADDTVPDPRIVDRALEQVAAGRQRARRLRLVVAASVLAILGLAGGLVPQFVGGSGSPGTTVAATDPVTHVRATADLVSKPWGTEITLRLSQMPEEERCSLIVRAADGHTETAGTWATGYRDQAVLTSPVSVPAAQLRELDVVTFGGQRLVSIPVHG